MIHETDKKSRGMIHETDKKLISKIWQEPQIDHTLKKPILYWFIKIDALGIIISEFFYDRETNSAAFWVSPLGITFPFMQLKYSNLFY